MLMFLGIVGGIFCALFCLFIGYKIAITKWQPKLMLEKLNEFIAANATQDVSLKNAEQNLTNLNQWYYNQISQLDSYMKQKYKDDIVEKNTGLLLNVSGKGIDLREKKDYDLDELLDKINKSGKESLDEYEKEYLKGFFKSEF